jgi:hypothetical protein
LWQRVELKGGVNYQLWAKMKYAGKNQNKWAQVFLFPNYVHKADEDTTFIDWDKLRWTGAAYTRKASEFYNAWEWNGADAGREVDINGDWPREPESEGIAEYPEITPENEGIYIVLIKIAPGITVVASDIKLIGDEESTAVKTELSNPLSIRFQDYNNVLLVRGISSKASATIYSITGSVVSKTECRPNETVSLSHLKSGAVYLVEVTESNNRLVQKFIK